MADDGYSGFWILAGAAAGLWAGYKLVPWMKRCEETEKLELIAQRVYNLAEQESVKLQALEELNKIKAYREGLEAKTANLTDDEHKSKLRVTKDKLLSVLRMINPWSKTAKENKLELATSLSKSED